MTEQPPRMSEALGTKDHVKRDEGSSADNLSTYAMLSKLGFPNSYRGKILFVAFLGTHVPMLALVAYLVLSSPIATRPALSILALVLVATLVGTAAAFWALRGLLAPLRLASSSLREYLDFKKIPALPIRFTDEAGRLMADVQYAVDNLDATIRSLEGLSGTDPLTGFYNRREAEKRLEGDVARAKRSGSVLTVCVVDVNQFKEVNDKYGHQAGDVCIRHLASIIGRNIREGDWLARWGGDEFILALHDASPFAPTGSVLQRIARDLKDKPVRLPRGNELVLTVSAGASRYSGEDGVEDLLASADAAMYEAKREGRPWLLRR